MEKDNCYFNLIDERSANFAKELGQGPLTLLPALRKTPSTSSAPFCPITTRKSSSAAAPAAWPCGGAPDFADILPEGGGKPNGLAEMLKHFGWIRDEAIAFGDGGNDVAMLEYAGIGVAMGNACDDAKAAADYVTTDIDKEGIAKALRHFGLV